MFNNSNNNMMICNASTSSINNNNTIKTSSSSSNNNTTKYDKSNIAIKCEQRGCACDSYVDGSVNKRICENCKHGWVIHGKQRLVASSF